MLHYAVKNGFQTKILLSWAPLPYCNLIPVENGYQIKLCVMEEIFSLLLSNSIVIHLHESR